MEKEATKTKGKYAYALGRRKTSTANVRLYEIAGESIINEKPLKSFVQSKVYEVRLTKPFEIAGLKAENFHFTSKTSGGGYNGQIDSIKLALSKAIIKIFPDKKKSLKDAGFLTRDPRMVERKKTGLHKARKREQYSKR